MNVNTVERVQQCSTPKEALLVLAEAIDLLAAAPKFVAPDPWTSELTWDDTPGQIAINKPDNRSVIENGDVIVQPVSQERKEARVRFAETARLHEFYGLSLSYFEFLEAYAKGGPRWLYYDNRECVMQMPMSLRRELVADVLLDSPSEADEIGRDILKFDESVPEGAAIESQRLRLGPVGS